MALEDLYPWTEDASLPPRFKAAAGRSEAHMRRGYAWPYPFSQAPSHTLQYPAIPVPVHTLQTCPCAHPAPCGERLLLPSATKRPAAICNLRRRCEALTPSSAAIAPSWLTLLLTHTPSYLLRTRYIKQASKRRPVCTMAISGTDALLVPGRDLGAALCAGLALVAVVAAAVPVRVPAARGSCSVHDHVMPRDASPLC